MTNTDEKSGADEESPTTARWSLLALGGTVSLCCLVAAPAATGATAAAAGGGTAAALGGGPVRIFVSALTVGLIGLVLRYRLGTDSCSSGG